MQLYNKVNSSRTVQDQKHTRDVLLAGKDADIDMLYQDAPIENIENTLRHFFSDYAGQHQKLTKDANYRKFRKFMKTATWKEGLQELKKLTN